MPFDEGEYRIQTMNRHATSYAICMELEGAGLPIDTQLDVWDLQLEMKRQTVPLHTVCSSGLWYLMMHLTCEKSSGCTAQYAACMQCSVPSQLSVITL